MKKKDFRRLEMFAGDCRGSSKTVTVGHFDPRSMDDVIVMLKTLETVANGPAGLFAKMVSRGTAADLARQIRAAERRRQRAAAGAGSRRKPRRA